MIGLEVRLGIRPFGPTFDPDVRPFGPTYSTISYGPAGLRSIGISVAFDCYRVRIAFLRDNIFCSEICSSILAALRAGPTGLRQNSFANFLQKMLPKKSTLTLEQPPFASRVPDCHLTRSLTLILIRPKISNFRKYRKSKLF